MTDIADTPKAIKPKRPHFLSFLCVIGFTYTGLFALLFLMGMLYSTGISGIMNKYLQLYDLSRLNFLIFSISMFLIFFTSFIGVLLMWKLQKLGFYIYTASGLIFLAAESIMSRPFLPDFIIHGLLILLFLIAFPFGKKRRARLLGKNILKKS